jgi:zinc/manganese transport system substrate-binding protein
MKKYLMAGFLLAWFFPAWAGLEVFATVPEWAALAQTLGGEQVTVFAATHGLQDPHRVEARPSLMVKARQAQLLIATGAELEVGWLPLVLRESGNAAIQPGRPGYFEASSVVNLLERPARLDRANGDVHPGGNPHIQLDPRNILKVARALTQRLMELDPSHAGAYQKRGAAFEQSWQAALTRWEAQAAPLRGVAVWVHHRSFVYLSDWLGLKELGALEPKPGVEPSSAHLASVLQRQRSTPAKLVIRARYNDSKASLWLAEQAQLTVVELPFTVGGTPQAKDLYGLFDDTIQRLLAGLK